MRGVFEVESVKGRETMPITLDGMTEEQWQSIKSSFIEMAPLHDLWLRYDGVFEPMTLGYNIPGGFRTVARSKRSPVVWWMGPDAKPNEWWAARCVLRRVEIATHTYVTLH